MQVPIAVAEMLVTAFALAQAALFRRQTGRTCIFLVDDIAAELDTEFTANWHRQQCDGNYETGPRHNIPVDTLYIA